MKLTTELENNACFYVDGEKGKETHVQKKKWRSYISARILTEMICGHLDYGLFQTFVMCIPCKYTQHDTLSNEKRVSRSSLACSCRLFPM